LAIRELLDPDSGSKLIVADSDTWREKESKNKQDQDELLPLVTHGTGYEIIKIIPKLKKAPQVTKAQNSSNTAGGYGADESDIFNDFFGSSSPG
jgi:hypothetical protein